MLSLRWPFLLLLLVTGCTRPSCGREGLLSVGVQTRTFQLIPLGQPDPEELKEVLPALQKYFPGLEFTLEQPQPIPNEVWTDRKSVMAELLMDLHQNKGPGEVLLLDADLSTQVFSFVYSQVDLPRGNAVVALPRMRTADGHPPLPNEPYTEEDQARAQHRIANQTVNAVGKLLGLFPCKDEHCVFRRPESVVELDKVNHVCARHAAHLEEKLGALTAGDAGAGDPTPPAASQK